MELAILHQITPPVGNTARLAFLYPYSPSFGCFLVSGGSREMSLMSRLSHVVDEEKMKWDVFDRNVETWRVL